MVSTCAYRSRTAPVMFRQVERQVFPDRMGVVGPGCAGYSLIIFTRNWLITISTDSSEFKSIVEGEGILIKE